MKIKKVTVIKEEVESEYQLPAYFKKDNVFCRFYLEGEDVKADKVEIGEEYQGLNLRYPQVCYEGYAATGKQITEGEWLTAIEMVEEAMKKSIERLRVAPVELKEEKETV